MASKRARENGGDEIAVAWAGGVFKDEFDLGLVKGGVSSPSSSTLSLFRALPLCFYSLLPFATTTYILRIVISEKFPCI